MNKLLVFLVTFLLLNSCVGERASKNTSSVSTKKGTESSTIKSGLNSIGSHSGNSQNLISTVGDHTIEFSNSSSGLRVCKYPSGVCRTNADEGSGGASAYGDIPNSQKSFLHYMKFRFYSNGYFAKNPDGHFAFGLRGKRMRVEEYGDKAGVDGRGMIIGAIGYGYFYNKNNKACVERMAQIESFYKTALNEKKAEFGNKIFPETCSDSVFEDHKWYSVELEVTSHQYILYKIFDSAGRIIYKSYLNDQPNYIDSNLTGWFIGHVFESKNTQWSVRLENFEVGHIVDGDVFYPVKGFTSPLTFSVNDVLVPAEKMKDYSIIVHKSSSPRIKLNNVHGRTRVYGCANFRKTKTSLDSVDCQNPDNYRIMTLNSTSDDWIYNGESYNLKETFVDSYPAQFYTIYFRLNPQDALTEVALSLELKEGTTQAASGKFCDKNSNTLTNWICGPRPSGASWVDVGSGCFHQATSNRCP